jgi:hypothetical protein
MVASGGYFVNLVGIPVERLADAALMINLRAARALALTIPHPVLIRTVEVCPLGGGQRDRGES